MEKVQNPMFAIVLALLWFGWVVYVKDQPQLMGYHDATEFLYYWFGFWGGLGLLITVIMLVLASLGMGLGFSSGMRTGIGKLVGFTGGAVVTAGGGALVSLFLIVRTVCLVAGAYLMMHASDGAMDINHLNNSKAIFGAILILAGLFLFRSSSSSRRSSDD